MLLQIRNDGAFWQQIIGLAILPSLPSNMGRGGKIFHIKRSMRVVTANSAGGPVVAIIQKDVDGSICL
jgi:hypothetical protein